jgi:hypothetical protein
MSGSISAGGQRQTQKQTYGYDTPTTQYINGEEGNAVQAGANGPGAGLTGAMGYGTGAMGAGNLGLGALSGNQGAVSQLMNPYISGVINANNDQWKNVNAQTQNQVNSAATMGGAFGGSRYGVALGTALAHNNQAQAQQTAGLLDQGYGQAMGQAGQLAGYGFQGANMGSQLGLLGVDNPSLWMANVMKNGYLGPTGGQSSNSGGGTSAGFNLGFGGGKQ